MGDSQSFDDQFNDGLFRTTLSVSSLNRPNVWPKSVSEMRGHTSFDGQGISASSETSHSDFMQRRASATTSSYPYYENTRGRGGQNSSQRASMQRFTPQHNHQGQYTNGRPSEKRVLTDARAWDWRDSSSA